MAPIPRIKLNSGHLIPLVGFGIWKVPQDRAADAVYNAIRLGYRHIDGAYDYRNSKQAGQGIRRAIADGLVRREELFVTSKLWNNHHAYDHAIKMARFENDTWGIGYLDLYLVHFPVASEWVPPEEVPYPGWYADEARTRVARRERVPLSETWAALESIVTSDGEKANPNGFVKSIGVSNFHTQLLYDLLSYAKVLPAILQVEHHPYLVQPQLVQMAKENGLAVTAYSTFGPQSFLELGNKRATNIQPLLLHPLIQRIAQRHGRTPSQVLLRWCTQREVIVIPKSNSSERLAQNLDCCSFDMSAKELDDISGLDQGLRFNDPGFSVGHPLRIFT